MIIIININKQNNYYETNFIKLEAIIIMVGANLLSVLITGLKVVA